MEHIKILGAFVNLIVGTWIVVYTFQIYKSHAYPFLLPLVYHTVLYNLMILILLIIKYFSLNLPDNFPLKKFPGSEDIATLFFSIFFIGMTISMFVIVFRFFEKKISLRAKRWIFSGLIVLAISHGVKIISPHQDIVYRWLYSIHEHIVDIIVVSEIILLIVLLIKGRKFPDKDKIRITKTFAIMYLSRYLFVGLLIVLPASIRYFGSIGIFLLFNLIPFFWLNYFFLKYAERMFSYIDDKKVLEPIFDKYNISKREQEILELILNGKSNREIEDMLYISIHTVKNHIYNIYQKLGVNSRYQLVHFFTKSVGVFVRNVKNKKYETDQ